MHSTSYAAFPLANEKPPEVRPPWEPRSRFEIERDISETRSLNKQLGKAVSWIVDALLQDEDGVKDKEQLKSIQLKKREALESLAYVRDVLNGGIARVEEERLWGEHEFGRRRSESAEVTTRNSDNSSFERLDRPQINKPRPVAPIPVHIGESRSQAVRGSRRLSSSLLGEPSCRPPPRSLSPSSPPVIQSSFSGVGPPVASALPRIPPPTSATYRPRIPGQIEPSPPYISSNRSPHLEVQHDPLGVL
jgi:TBC1 domain family protein 5